MPVICCTGKVGPIHLESNSVFVGVGSSYAYSAGSSWTTWTPPGNSAAVSAFAVQPGIPLFYTEWIGTGVQCRACFPFELLCC